MRGEDPGGHTVEIEHRPVSTVWVSVEGRLAVLGAGRLAAGLRRAMGRSKVRVVLDMERLRQIEHEAAEKIAEALREHRDRIRVILPRVGEFASIAAVFSLYR